MTITWADLKSDIRVDLKDPSGTKWSDDSLFVWAKDAIRDFSTWFPKRVDSVEVTATDEDGLIYSLPTDFVEVIYVECPADTYLEERQPRPGTHYSSTPKPYSFMVDGGSLVLSGPPQTGDAVYLTYYGIHTLPNTASDDTAMMTFADNDAELIRLYVYAKAHAQMRGNQARLDRFRETGKRDDNPIEPEVDNPMDEYNRKIAQRFGGGSIKLYRPGRVR